MACSFPGSGLFAGRQTSAMQRTPGFSIKILRVNERDRRSMEILVFFAVS
jgi:hypothetical protein